MNYKNVIVAFVILFCHQLCLIESANYQESGKENTKVYADIDSFKEQINKIPLGIIKEKKIDLNNDGKLDYLIFITGGEEITLGVLLAQDSDYLLIDIPQGEEYEIVLSTDERFALRIGRAPIPGFGNDILGDILRYDYYEFKGNGMFKANERYPKAFKKLIVLYETRIKEIENINYKNQEEILFRGKLDKYRKFIKDASEIIVDEKPDYSELSRSPEECKKLIEKTYPNYRLLDIEDLDASVRDYYDKHVLNANPFLVEKDINGDELVDFAFLIKESKSNAKLVLFVILIQKEKGRFDKAYESEYDYKDKDLFIIPIPPWRFYWDNAQLTNPSVGLYSYGKPEGTIFWWNEEKAKLNFGSGKELIYH